MNKAKTNTNSLKELPILFKFFLFVLLIVGLVFLLNGPIKSNFGYESIDALAAAGDPATNGGRGVGTSQQPRVIQSQNTGVLKQNWIVPQTPATSLDYISNLEKKILDESNTNRTNKGLNPLTWEDNLAGTARYHSHDMGARKFFSHINPDNVGPFFRISKLHRRFIGSGGENIIMLTKDNTDPDAMAKKIVTDWMNSTGHRQNILNKDYTALGVGVVEMPDKNNPPILYATQLFGTPTGYLQQDFPAEVSGGQKEDVTVLCVDKEYQPPLGGEIVDINSKQIMTFQLIASSNTGQETSSGKISAPSQAAVYQLVFHFPFKKNPATYAIVPGPIFTVL